VADDLVGVLDPGERVGAFVPAVDVGPVVVSRSLTLSKVPRRIGWRVMITKKISTMFSQLPLVGVKCSCTRRCLTSHARTIGGLRTAHQAQPAGRRRRGASVAHEG
jgi:hypothetical protein